MGCSGVRGAEGEACGGPGRFPKLGWGAGAACRTDSRVRTPGGWPGQDTGAAAAPRRGDLRIVRAFSRSLPRGAVVCFVLGWHEGNRPHLGGSGVLACQACGIIGQLTLSTLLRRAATSESLSRAVLNALQTFPITRGRWGYPCLIHEEQGVRRERCLHREKGNDFTRLLSTSPVGRGFLSASAAWQLFPSRL